MVYIIQIFSLPIQQFFLHSSFIKCFFSWLLSLSCNNSSRLSDEPPRWFFKISVLFFQEQPFYNFPGGSICVYLFVKQTCFLQAGGSIMFFELTQIFQKCLSNRHVFSKMVYLFVEQTLIISSNTYKFSRSLYFLIEQILIFQEALSSPQTHSIFQETPMPQKQIGIFQEGTPHRTDISLTGLGGCFRLLHRYQLNTDNVFHISQHIQFFPGALANFSWNRYKSRPFQFLTILPPVWLTPPSLVYGSGSLWRLVTPK